MTTPKSSARQAIEQYLYLLDDAFAGPDWHSLLSNLNTATPNDWEWVPPGGARSIRQIVSHLGRNKFIAHDQAFGAGTLTWDDPDFDREADAATSDIPTAIAWLRGGHERLHEGIAALADDSELLRPRRTNWGELRETRWVIVVTMIQHDLYHAGEINHLRALRQGNDEWEE
ncbi:MAG TPA: DinB family protein [Ktedonobacterales bacterium]|nr:DinB family protein [Ktedonobacterales bacterium]